MRRPNVVAPFAAGLAGVLLAAAGRAGDPGKKPAPADAQRVVIPFDFESKFDDGRYGQILGDMVWKKIQRRGGFVLPEAMTETREWCERNKFLPGPDTPLAKLKDIVRDQQAADIAVWGKVERVAGHDTDVYDLWLYVADFSVDPPRMLYEKKARTQTVSEIPHTYVQEALDRLYGVSSEVATTAPDPAAEERWQKGPNLVQGDFEKGRGHPAGWDPLPRYISWVAEPGRRPANHIIRFAFPEDVAGSSGVLFYSDYFPVQAGAKYRFQCRWRTTGPAVKVFIKCYDEMPGAFHGKSGAASGTEKREVYRSQQNLQGDANTWNVHTEDFTPTHTQYTPRWGRVMLYAYWPAGRVDWDDIVVKRIAPPPAGAGEKDRRPSLETKVRTGEIK